jgi:hypothetical protein
MLIWCHRVFTAAVLLDRGWTRMAEAGVANVQKNAGEKSHENSWMLVLVCGC